jgi:hypothetical protein
VGERLVHDDRDAARERLPGDRHVQPGGRRDDEQVEVAAHAPQLAGVGDRRDLRTGRPRRALRAARRTSSPRRARAPPLALRRRAGRR